MVIQGIGMWQGKNCSLRYRYISVAGFLPFVKEMKLRKAKQMKAKFSI